MTCITIVLKFLGILCFVRANIAKELDLEIEVKDSGPVVLDASGQIEIGLHYSGVEPNFDIVVTFLPEETENPVVEITADQVFFSSSEIKHSVTKNITAKGIQLGYTTLQVRKFVTFSAVLIYYNF